ncbi:MAG: contractile injection system tape measure protein [bacterium]
MAHHIIHRINLEVKVPDREAAQAIHTRMPAILKNDILPALEKLLDRVDPQGQNYRWENINLDLKTISPEILESGISEMVAEKLQEKLRIQLSSVPETEKNKEEAPLLISEEEKSIEKFLYFLQTGQLPWWSSHSRAMLKPEEWLKIPSRRRSSLRKQLVQLLTENPVALERFALQFPQAEVIKFVISLATGKQPQETEIRKISQRISRNANGLREEITRLLKNITPPPEKPGRSLQPEDVSVKKRTPKPNKKDEGILVQNAGIVLLHPFLGSFFSALGLLKNTQFTDKQAQHTAIHLLHYLSAGQTQPMEYELTLEKYLCGCEPEEVVPRFVPISKTMKQESDKLLRAAIEHWKALKKTSPAGLREGFLQREGKLIQNDAQDLLLVESKSVDVLLSYLPWGLGVIKLPWLNKPFTVELNH